jgi:hypothetical protein
MQGGHAYMAISGPPDTQGLGLKNDPDFQEIQVKAADLDKLPPGAIVVWEQGSSPSGHISIADGKKHEISCHIQDQMSTMAAGRLASFCRLNKQSA